MPIQPNTFAHQVNCCLQIINKHCTKQRPKGKTSAGIGPRATHAKLEASQPKGGHVQTCASLKLPAAVCFNVIPQTQGAVSTCAGTLCCNTPQAQDEGCRLSHLVVKAGISRTICCFCQVVWILRTTSQDCLTMLCCVRRY